MAKKKITVEEGGKLNESVSSHVNAGAENNVNNANKKGIEIYKQKRERMIIEKNKEQK